MSAVLNIDQLSEKQEVYILRMERIIVTILSAGLLLFFTGVHAGPNPSSGIEEGPGRGIVPKKDVVPGIPEAYDCVVVSKIGETTPIKDLTQTSRGVFRFYPEGGTGKSVLERFKEQRAIRFISADNRLEFVSVKLTDRNGKESEGRIENNLLAGWSQLGAEHPDWTAMPHNLRVIYMR